jgi:hypothetical protein
MWCARGLACDGEGRVFVYAKGKSMKAGSIQVGQLYRSCSLTQIAVFEAVGRLGSITRAAEEVSLAQPTVSLQMKRFAGSLGLKLFEVKGRRLHLTEAGREVHAACEEILQRVGVLEALARRAGDGVALNRTPECV